MVPLRCAGLLTLALAGLLARPVAAQVPRPVQAGPDDLRAGLLSLPAPEAVALRGAAALLPVAFDGQGRWRAELPAGPDGRLTLALLSPEAPAWRLALAGPDGADEPLATWLADGRAALRREPLASLPGAEATVVDLSPGGAGPWRLTVDHRPGAAPGLLALADGGPTRLVSHLRDWRLTADRSLGLVAFAEGAPGARLERVTVRLGASGDGPLVALHDDGAHGDGAPGDGRFAGELPPLPPGPQLVVVQAEGRDGAGRPVLRSNWHLLAVAAPGPSLAGAAALLLPDDPGQPLQVRLPVTGVEPGRRVQVGAEVWGRDAAGDEVPVAWLGRLAAPAADGTIALPLDRAWLTAAGVDAALELRAVRLQDVDGHAVLDRSPRVALEPRPVAALPATGALTASGSTTASGRVAVGPRFAWDRGLMLVHGYCSGGNVWPLSDFSGDLVVFSDPDQNRSHDQFAQLIASTAQAAGKESFGVVGHSQGGPAALHLLTYYTSGLDLALGGRRIQSVGSPYQGTPLAGSLAGIGAVFGAGCGENTDLAPEGAALWLAGIPGASRAQVHYWTTANDGGACEFVTSLFLADPEDGTTERFRGQLPGAVNEGHVVGWCHTTGMSDPAQYLDAVLNAERDATAAR